MTQTFTIFPGVLLIRDLNAFKNNEDWSTVILILVFNTFDTLGKYSTQIKHIYNNITLSMLVMTRFIFLSTFILHGYWNMISSDAYIIISLACFAWLQGFTITEAFT